MDFVIGFSRTQKSYDSIWVIVDRLTKFAHFIPIKSTRSVKDHARIFTEEIVCCHCNSLSIILDRGAQFTFRFWWLFKKDLATTVKLSITFHPQTYGQAERTIQTFDDILRECIIDFKRNWDKNLTLVEFAYNNSFHSSISMAPYEALYDRRCRSHIGWFEVGEP